MEVRNSSSITQYIQSANKILVTTHSRPSLDAIASLGVLYTMLKEMKKQVDLAIPATLPARALSLLDLVHISKDMIIDALPPRMYTISIKKDGQKIESVNFNEDEKKGIFNFVITPFDGTLDLNSVKITQDGSDYDLIIAVDTPSLNFLGDLYKKNVSLFSTTPIVSIDSHKSNANYAKLTITKDVDTTSEVVMQVLDDIGVQLNDTFAQVLYTGIFSAITTNRNTTPRSSTLNALASLVEHDISMQIAHDILYSPATLNEIFLTGDILDSANEGTSSKYQNAKVVACKISLNKEEVETVDIEKVAQVIFWNIHIPETKLAFVVFQKSQNDSVVYMYNYDAKLDIHESVNALEGKNEKQLIRFAFGVDMNTAEMNIKDTFGIEYIQKKSKFASPLMDDSFDSPLDFGSDFPMPNFPTPSAPPLMPPTPVAPVTAAASPDGNVSKAFNPQEGH